MKKKIWILDLGSKEIKKKSSMPLILRNEDLPVNVENIKTKYKHRKDYGNEVKSTFNQLRG